jgi:CRP-like cAMP-binding protein
VRSIPPDTDIVRQGDRPAECCLILEGFACRYQTTDLGKRQILSFHVPGDMPDLQSLYLSVIDDNLGTLVPTRAAFIPHRALYALFGDRPELTGVFWRNTLIDGALFRRWVLNVGRHDAYARTAHLFCELLVRLKAVGLVTDDTIDLPVTQAELADALGITTVHVNRTLKDLRRDGLITQRGARLTVNNWDALVSAGDFDPTYLHLRDPIWRSGPLR